MGATEAVYFQGERPVLLILGIRLGIEGVIPICYEQGVSLVTCIILNADVTRS